VLLSDHANRPRWRRTDTFGSMSAWLYTAATRMLLPWDELAHLHFNDRLLSMLAVAAAN